MKETLFTLVSLSILIIFYLSPQRFLKSDLSLKKILYFSLFSIIAFSLLSFIFMSLIKFSYDWRYSLFIRWALLILILIKPASLIIKLSLSPFQVTEESNDSIHNAGQLIGILERLILVLLLYQDQYSAMGFILTAKSIARYNKIAESPAFAESYLLGTLLSSFIAISSFFLIF